MSFWYGEIFSQGVIVLPPGLFARHLCSYIDCDQTNWHMKCFENMFMFEHSCLRLSSSRSMGSQAVDFGLLLSVRYCINWPRFVNAGLHSYRKICCNWQFNARNVSILSKLWRTHARSAYCNNSSCSQWSGCARQWDMWRSIPMPIALCLLCSPITTYDRQGPIKIVCLHRPQSRAKLWVVADEIL